MREFTISKCFQLYEFKLLEDRIGQNLPEHLFLLLEKYAGLGIEERSFPQVTNDLHWTISKFLRFAEIYNFFSDIEEELSIAELNMKMISFALEENGWRFCISTEQNFPVYIFKTTDHSGKDAFEKIADSFDEFINGLKLPS